MTMVVMVLLPTVSVTEPDAAPLATVVPLTLIVAPPSFAVGVNVMLEVALGTDAV